MDEREYPSFGKVVIEVAKPMIVAAVLVFFFTTGMPLLLLATIVIAGLVGGPVVIWLAVRSFNDCDDPHQQKQPPDLP